LGFVGENVWQWASLRAEFNHRAVWLLAIAQELEIEVEILIRNETEVFKAFASKFKLVVKKKSPME
jgi:hypothetical protein